jgi:hypothetical protein
MKTHKEEGHVTTEAQIGVMQLQIETCLVPLEVRKKQGRILETVEGT